jgi:mannose-1-phosphate guanylyltransferase
MSRVPSHALVLAAGLGTRLHPLTTIRAKPAVPVAGTPLIRRIIKWLAASGVTDQVLNLHHLPATLTSVVGDGRDLGARVRYSWESPRILGSAGGPRQALPLIEAERFFLVNGDTLTDVNLEELARAHAEAGALVTLALVPNTEPQKYGGVELDAGRPAGRVVGFPRRGPGAARTGHFIGVQVVEAEAFRGLAQGEAMSTIPDLYDRLLRERPGSVRGVLTDAHFWDVGTAADYLRTSLAFTEREGLEAVSCGQGVRIDPTARVTHSVLWDDIDVGPRCRLDECIVGDGVRVPAGRSYKRSVLVNESGELIVSSLGD